MRPLAILYLIGYDSTVVRFKYAVDSSAVVRQVVLFADRYGDLSDNPVTRMLRNRLRCEISLNEYLEDVPTILFLTDEIDSRF